LEESLLGEPIRTAISNRNSVSFQSNPNNDRRSLMRKQWERRWIIWGVASICISVELLSLLDASLPAPYERVKPGMSMKKVYELIGESEMSDKIGSGGMGHWDGGRIAVEYRPGSLTLNESEQKVTEVYITRGYQRLRWLRYRLKRCYADVEWTCRRYFAILDSIPLLP
jgi:hypothetical protein